MRYARTRPGPMFLASTAVVCDETTKLIACTILITLAFFRNAERSQWSWQNLKLFWKREVFTGFYDYVKMSVPALCYAVQKNALYLAITHLQAAVFQITYQGKILTTALFSVLMLHKRLSHKQVLSLVVLLVGVSIVQLSQLKENDDDTKKDNASLLVGICAILFACMTSGFAAVYFEYMLKRGSTGKDGAPNVQKPYTIWVRNFQLASFASTSAICTMLIKDHEALRQNGFFYGYSPLTWTTIFLEAGGGLIVAVVIKYADTILKNFATAAAIISSTTISALFLGFEVRPTFVIGAALVITAIYMYSAKPAEPPAKNGYDELDNMESGQSKEMSTLNDGRRGRVDEEASTTSCTESTGGGTARLAPWLMASAQVHTPAPSVDVSRIDGPVNCAIPFECPPFDSPTSMRSDLDAAVAGVNDDDGRDVAAALAGLHTPVDENIDIFGNATDANSYWQRPYGLAGVKHDCPVVEEASVDDTDEADYSYPDESVDEVEPLSDDVMAQLESHLGDHLSDLYEELVASSVPNYGRTYNEDMQALEELETAYSRMEGSARADELRDTFTYYLESERMFLDSKHSEQPDYSRLMTRYTPMKSRENDDEVLDSRREAAVASAIQSGHHGNIRRTSVSSTTSSHIGLPIGLPDVPRIQLNSLPTPTQDSQRAAAPAPAVLSGPPLSARPLPRWSDVAQWPTPSFFPTQLVAPPATARFRYSASDVPPPQHWRAAAQPRPRQASLGGWFMGQ
ncbi:hypothetical protein FOZ61_008330 [Perkinsus olseni]|uniref:Uncharacterized protein n=1 Tax=Perkinsus olseni TaxID=32597 RepID=A0A7J6L585_PEROL|nr:hypothetical protein FOZ61_008330 [Perkinsus olseni]